MQTYTTEDLTDILKVNKRTIRELIASGQLKAKKVGRSYIVTENQLREFLES